MGEYWLRLYSGKRRASIALYRSTQTPSQCYSYPESGVLLSIADIDLTVDSNRVVFAALKIRSISSRFLFSKVGTQNRKGSLWAACKLLVAFGWEAGIRTPIGGSRVRSLTVRRPPSAEFQFTSRCSGLSTASTTSHVPKFSISRFAPLRIFLFLPRWCWKKVNFPIFMELEIDGRGTGNSYCAI
jgi:hypothetical protein